MKIVQILLKSITCK